MATIVLASCAGSGGGSPAPSPLDLPAVTAALESSGINPADVAENLNPRDGAWRCLPGSFQLSRVSQQPPVALAHRGDPPSVDWVATPHVVGARNVLLFIASDDPAALTAVQAAASSLGD
jgi:hypothetical protein